MAKNLKIIIFLSLFVSVLMLGHFTWAQTATDDAVAKRQAALQAELDKTQKDIDYWANILAGKQKETASISRDISILNAKIAEANALIKKKNIIAQQLGKDITAKVATIETLDQKMERQKSALAELIRKTNEVESYSVGELVLSGKPLSDFFVDLEASGFITESLNSALALVRETRIETEAEKEDLSKKQAAEIDARKAAEAEQRLVKKNEEQKKQLLAVNKNQEKAYQSILSERQKAAAKIRSALFALRDSASIPFGTAYNYALEVQKVTGVRPAFLLAILTQETNLGENVGQCLVTNLVTGDGVGKNTGTVFKGIMKPTRDLAPFINLASRLGFDPASQPVSCPQGGGYGGAMGPSQFIPSTWVGYEKRIAAATGVAIPNPWIAHDAFFASALYLADLGAGAGGYSAESAAAAKYYAGSNWKKTAGQNYASSVMGHAQNIQENMIDPLQNL
ncbi:MAG: lytic murein transglycosylase [Patescibacteria group bacterium]